MNHTNIKSIKMKTSNIINFKIIFSFAISIFLLANCTKDPNPEPIPETDPVITTNGVFICNEGNFMYGNASVSYYDIETKSEENQIFFNANEVPLGDVCQSMEIIDGKAFIVMNNSGKIQVADTASFKYISTITGLNSPRYITKAASDKYYITDLYSSFITIVEPDAFLKKGEINVGRSTEMMVKVDNYIYTTSWSFSNKVYKIDTRTDTVTDSLEVTMQPNSITADKHGNIWVLSDGGYAGSPAGQQRAALCRINSSAFEVDYTYTLPTDESSPTRLVADGKGEVLYFINGAWGATVNMGGICKVSGLDSGSPKVELIIPEEGRLFYGLGVDPSTSEVYVSDALDFTQKGVVYRYSAEGALVHQFQADIIPGFFCFK
jgi:DNA-binding beta-propeller fold protein YncE